MEDIINIEDISGVQKRISITVSPESVNKKFDEFFIDLRKDTEVKGFRKGKAPLPVLRQYFGTRAKGSVSQMIVSEFYNKALKDYNLNPVGNPDVENKNSNYVGKFNPDNSYFVSLLIETLPTFEPVGYKGLELNFPTHDKEALANKKLTAHREQFAERNQIMDRGVRNGDTAVIDFQGFIDGSPFEGGTATGFSINIGNSSLIPGFEEQLVDMKVGETKVIKVKFPNEYHAASLAGKDASFEIKLHTIVEIKLAEVNNDLALMTGHNSVEELLATTNKEVEDECVRLDKSNLENQIVAKLLKQNSFDAPKSMVEDEKKRLLNRIGPNNLTPQIENNLMNSAMFSVKKAILLDTIYEKETEVEITPEELDNLLEEHAKQNNITKDQLVSTLYNSNQMDAFMGVLRSHKVVDFIIKNAVKLESEK